MTSFDQRAGRRAFGAAVKTIRLDRGFTQEQLAHVADLDRSYVVGIEGGTRNPSLDVILKVARGLGVSPSAFFD